MLVSYKKLGCSSNGGAYSSVIVCTWESRCQDKFCLNMSETVFINKAPGEHGSGKAFGSIYFYTRFLSDVIAYSIGLTGAARGGG